MSNEALRQRKAGEYPKYCKKTGKVKPLEEYINCQTPIKHFCLIHKEIHPASPNNIKNGRGLKCCRIFASRERGKKKNLEMKKIYKSRIKKIHHGNIVALEEYIDWETPIKHYCKKHDMSYPATPNQILSGRGLKCCKSRQGYLKHKADYYEKCSKLGRVIPLEEYKGISEKISHYCLRHNQIHPAAPHTILQGHGLKCCNDGGDSFERFKNDEAFANGDCNFYLADLDDIYLKVGITNDLVERKRREKYRSYIFTPLALIRAEAWTIEQIILSESVNSIPKIIPKKFESNSGLSEIRERKGKPIYFYQNRYQVLLEEIASKGWEEVYLSRFEI